MDDQGRAGWIKLHRRLAGHPLWLRERFTRGQAWVDLLMSAAHADHQVVRGGRLIDVRRGQVYGSQAALAERWRWTRETVSTFLRDLQKAEMISDISTVRGADIGYTLLTIKNYEQYQERRSDASDISSDISPDVSSDIQKKVTTRSKEGGTLLASLHSSNGRTAKRNDKLWGRP